MDIKSVKPQPIQNDLDTQLRQAAKMYEQQFLGEMMRAMRKTVEHSEVTKPSMAEKIYQDELYSQYAEKWVDNGGNGLADLIYKELKEKIIPSQYSRYVQQQAPVEKKKIGGEDER
ncbi:MAG: rod-binding protein [Bdellovibrionaceae bacterium]|nr:rod-binding protein [Pseudobdellovibrionaceae bacterium]